ncbi:unnamed protein product [Fraxinus pennsylvanica]|uniref:ER lumen protein-retaining receptor n=1 Tax=Fraxinus pennsylvanica TaxID=56036 RepID=A0AAD2A5V4_9LAMI|nr:unnamed protein product [Fraxinus pennsylvanica]
MVPALIYTGVPNKLSAGACDGYLLISYSALAPFYASDTTYLVLEEYATYTLKNSMTSGDNGEAPEVMKRTRPPRISLKTLELYALVFLALYLDLFTDFISVYYTIMKLLDTFRHYFLVGASFLLALLVHEKFTFQEILRTFSIYLEAIAIIPQLVLLQRSGNVDNLTGQYVFFLGAYRAFYILNWVYRYFTEKHFSRWISCFSGLIQTALYADFFYYYHISWKTNAKLQLPA